MKQLVKSNLPPTSITVTDPRALRSKNDLTFRDIIDILNQIEELQKYNISLVKSDGALHLSVGDSIYEIGKPSDDRYPRRRLRKLDV